MVCSGWMVGGGRGWGRGASRCGPGVRGVRWIWAGSLLPGGGFCGGRGVVAWLSAWRCGGVGGGGLAAAGGGGVGAIVAGGGRVASGVELLVPGRVCRFARPPRTQLKLSWTAAKS